jgi:hypothetical protein
MGPTKLNKFMSQQEMTDCICNTQRASRLTHFLLKDKNCHVNDEGALSLFADALMFEPCDTLTDEDNSTNH